MRLGVTAGLMGGLAAGVCLGSGPARAADFAVLKVSGVWTAFQTKTATGQSICGIRVMYPDKREFYIKWFDGQNRLAIQAFKPTWVVPPNISASVTLTFAGGRPYPFKSAETPRTSDFLEFYVPKANVKDFTKDMTTSSTAKIEFPGGNEPLWPLNMTGVSGALDAMVRCIDTVAGPAATDTPYSYLHVPVATQPFGGTPVSPSTQPFGGAAPPSQPFGSAPEPVPAPSQPFAPESIDSGAPKTPE